MQTNLKLFGLPLVHVARGRVDFGSMVARPGIARGWIAIGDIAFGVVAIGGIGVGAISVGGLAVGALALGGGAIGVISLGGLAIGYEAFGGAALAWKAASGGLAVAREIATGGEAHARHANDAAAQAFVSRDPILRACAWVLGHSRWLVLLAVLPAAAALLRRIRSESPK